MALLLPRRYASAPLPGEPKSAAPTKKHAVNSDDFLDPEHVREQVKTFLNYSGAVPMPVGWRIAVLVLTLPETTSGGLIMVDEYLEARSLASPQGIVVAVGASAYEDETRFPGKVPWVKVGDRIMFQKYAGRMFQLRTGQHIAILNDTDPAGVVDADWLTTEGDAA